MLRHARCGLLDVHIWSLCCMLVGRAVKRHEHVMVRWLWCMSTLELHNVVPKETCSCVMFVCTSARMQSGEVAECRPACTNKTLPMQGSANDCVGSMCRAQVAFGCEEMVVADALPCRRKMQKKDAIRMHELNVLGHVFVIDAIRVVMPITVMSVLAAATTWCVRFSQRRAVAMPAGVVDRNPRGRPDWSKG